MVALTPGARSRRTEFCPHMLLNKEITAMTGTNNILELSSVRSTEWDQVNLLTTLHRIAKFGDPGTLRADDRFQLILRNVEALHRDFNGYALSNTSWAIAALSMDIPLLKALAS
mmetsp:Transcript_4925/g.8952  ORF Transcript_4925/g.8952 Transcript_4925/m.8952 type:complete len:114 (+) Transcript_4925:103-444(+)